MTESRVVITADETRAVAGFQRFRTQAVSALDNVSQAGSVIGNVLGAVGASLSIAAFTGWIKGAIDATDAASDLSQKTGIAIEDLAGMELAFEKGGMEAGALESSMAKLSKQIVDGNEAFERLGVSTKDNNGQFKTNKDMLYELADSFADMEDGVQKTAIAQEIFGKSGAAMIPMLNEGSKGLREMDEMARKLGLSLSEEAVENAGNFNDTLDLLAKGGQGVARGIAAELLPTLSNLTGQFLTTMTSGDKLKNTAAFLAAGLKILYTAGIGIVEVFSTVGKTVGAAGAQLVAILQGNFKQAAEIGRMWQQDVGNSWAATIKSIEAAWDDSSNAAVDSMVSFTRNATVVGKSAAEVAEESKKAAKAHQEEAKALAEVAGLTGDFAAEWDKLSGLYAKGRISLEQLTKAQADLLAKQPAMKAAAEEEEKQRKALIASAEQYATAYDLAADAKAKALAGLQAQRDENEAIGLGAIELAELNAQRVESRAQRAEENAEIAEGLDLTGEMAQKYRDEAAALRELAGEMRQGARAKIAVDEAKSAEDAWKKGSETIEKSLTDALFRGFESGKSIGRNLVDTLKNLFNTLVLRPMIQPIGNAVGNFVNGAMGMPGAAQAAGGGLAGLTGAASNLYGMVTGGATLAGGLGTGFLGSLAGGLNGAGIGSGLTSALGMNIGSSIASVVGPNVASGIATGLSGLAAAAPWVAGALAIYSIGKAAFGRGPKEFTGEQTLNGSIGTGGFTGTMDAAWVKKGGWFRSDKKGVDPNQVNAEFAAGLTSAYDAIKASSANFARVLGINADSIANRTQAISIAMGKDEAANQKAIADFFSGVADTVAGELLPSVTAFSKAGEAASATLQRLATDYATIDAALMSIGMVFGSVGTASSAARNRLIEASGGREAFAANTAGFQQNYLTEEERNAPVLKQVRELLADMGLAWVDTRDELKAEVLKLDPSKDGERLASLLKLQGAFAQVYPAIDKAAEAEKIRAEEAQAAARAMSVANAQRALEARELRLLGRDTEALRIERDLELAGIDPLLRAQHMRIWALEDEKAAAQEAASAIDNMKAALNKIAGAQAGIADDLFNARLGGMDVNGKIEQIKAAEQALWGQVGTGAESVDVLAKIKALAMQRIGFEDELHDQVIAGLREQYDARKGLLTDELAAMTKMRDYVGQLRGFADGLKLGNLSALSPNTQLAEAEAQYRKTLNLAQGGDAAAQGNLQGIAQSYLQLSKQFYGSTLEYSSVFANVISDIERFAAPAESEFMAVQQQISVINDMSASLGKTVRDTGDRQVAVLTKIDSALQKSQEATEAQLQQAAAANAALVEQLKSANTKLASMEERMARMEATA